MFFYQTVEGAVGLLWVYCSFETRIEEAEFLSQQRGFKLLYCISKLL